MKPIVSALVCLSMILLTASPAMLQERRARNGDSLRVRVELLETADIRSQSPMVQSIYKRSLLRLYNNYTSALEQEIAELDKILSAVGDADAATKNEVAARIKKLANERSLTNEKIQTLAGDLRADVSAAESSTPNPLADAPASSSYEQGSYRRAGSLTPVSHVVAAGEGATPRAESNFQTLPLLNTTSRAALAATLST